MQKNWQRGARILSVAGGNFADVRQCAAAVVVVHAVSDQEHVGIDIEAYVLALELDLAMGFLVDNYGVPEGVRALRQQSFVQFRKC